ncbi:hypothetical protein [Mucilaginibacter sp.]|jgi:hypothetical protein|uniref:hypothetical protein n=1 Tax=Mucilaginibacter sp. TaxID=1882438 RepID=UPI002D1B5E17|nr:hypothetical protein [Mucilaginibacter sp.]HTI60464.1 hypothetical protein [Mucilaginibacter sp.]
MDKEFFNFKNADPEYLEGVLLKIQRSFNIEFDNEGLKNVKTFGGVCDLIVSKINQGHADHCTTQHSFYQLRNSISAITHIDKCSITPHTRLSKLFPRETRLQVITEIEQDLGFDTKLLKPKQWVITLFSLLLMASVAGLFYNWQIGVAGILASLAGLKLAGKFGKEIHLKTVGDMANKICRESRHACTINKNEVEQKVREILEKHLQLQPVVLQRH